MLILYQRMLKPYVMYSQLIIENFYNAYDLQNMIRDLYFFIIYVLHCFMHFTVTIILNYI